MSNETLDISLFGREYRVACPPGEAAALREAVTFLDTKLREAAGRTQASGEKLAVMTALNITHEFLQLQRSGGFDMPNLKRRIELMNARLDGVIAQQDKPF